MVMIQNANGIATNDKWDGAKMQCAILQRFSALGLFLFRRGEVVEQQAMNEDVASAHFAQ